MIYNHFDIVVLPFPFTDRDQTKRRPAIVCSSAERFNDQSGHYVLAMITSQKNEPWPLDVVISDLKKAGLPGKSVIRMKLFTLDQRLIIKKIGVLSPKDQKNFLVSLQSLLP